MLKVLMVCLGNICRSPLAEGILKSKIDTSKVFVDSAGTGGWHIGELPDPRSVAIAAEHDLDLSDQRCRKFVVEDFDHFDWIFVMDHSNLKDVLSIARDQHDKNKVKLILDVLDPDGGNEVPDPYYGGSGGFESVFQLLNEACEELVKEL